MMLLPIGRIDPDVSPSSASKTECQHSRPNQVPLLGAVIVASALLQTCAAIYSDTTVAAETGGLIYYLPKRDVQVTAAVAAKGAGPNIDKAADKGADKGSDKSAGKGADKGADRGADKDSDKSAGKGADKGAGK